MMEPAHALLVAAAWAALWALGWALGWFLGWSDGWWATFSNLAYVLPAGVAAGAQDWLRCVAYAGVGVASGVHHYCYAFAPDPSLDCSYRQHEAQQADHVLAVFLCCSVATQLVPFTAARRDMWLEHGLQLLYLGASVVAVWYALNTEWENRAYLILIMGSFALSALVASCLLGTSTLGRWADWWQHTQHNPLERALLAATLAVATATLFVWYWSDWTVRPLPHGWWHVGTATVGAGVFVIMPRAARRYAMPYKLASTSSV